MKSILSEAAASGATPTHDSTNRQGKLSVQFFEQSFFRNCSIPQNVWTTYLQIIREEIQLLTINKLNLSFFSGIINGHHKAPSSLHGHKNGVTTPSTPKPPSLSSATDFTRIVIPGSPSSSTEQQLPANINSPTNYSTTLPNDFTQPLSIPTRLQSLNLINEAFRRFSAIEATLAAQRKQSQMTSSINSHRSRLNSTANNSSSTKQQQPQQNNESTIAQAQS
jgi:hypothetical protein